MARVTETRHWTWDDVREMCIRHGFYNEGTIDDYDALANSIRCYGPDVSTQIFDVAEDIWNHSFCEESIEDIMYLLSKEVIYSTFEIEGREPV